MSSTSFVEYFIAGTHAHNIWAKDGVTRAAKAKGLAGRPAPSRPALSLAGWPFPWPAGPPEAHTSSQDSACMQPLVYHVLRWLSACQATSTDLQEQS